MSLFSIVQANQFTLTAVNVQNLVGGDLDLFPQGFVLLEITSSANRKIWATISIDRAFTTTLGAATTPPYSPTDYGIVIAIVVPLVIVVGIVVLIVIIRANKLLAEHDRVANLGNPLVESW